LEEHEHTLVAGYNYLKHRAGEGIGALTASPTAARLDAIETDLRWAALLKTKLAWLGMPAAVRRVEHNLNRPLTHLPVDEIARLMRSALTMVMRTVETVNPARGQRLERAAAFAMDRDLARSPALPDVQRAAVRHGLTSGVSIEPGTSMVAWHWLILPRTWRKHVHILEALPRRAAMLRHGWSGVAPLTMAKLSNALGLTSIRCVRVLRSAEAALHKSVGSFSHS
jgi:hypothetical protein